MDLDQYLKELEYLVNIDSGSEDAEGVTKVADFFVEKFNEIAQFGGCTVWGRGTFCAKCPVNDLKGEAI